MVRVHSLYVGTSWMDLIVAFLKQRLLPKDKCEAEVVHSYLGPYLLCVHPKAMEPLLKELHEGIQGVGHWRTEPLPKDTSGLACKEPPRIM